MKLTLIFFLITTIFCELNSQYSWEEVKVPEYETLTTAFHNQSINRPLFHFTPKFGWMNDPNGMWIDESTPGETVYHLYFQFNPQDTVWGMPLDWGHATSTNLLDWIESDPAFGPEDGKSGAYSGSMFIDDDNMSEMFTEKNVSNLIAAYTFNDDQWIETQYLYFSDDGGNTFKNCSEECFPNPVVSHTEEKFEKQFRDPQVVKFKKGDIKGYLMSVAKSQEYKIAFYLSTTDLKQDSWKEQINLELEGFLGYQYECPNLAHLKNNNGKIDGEKDNYWVLFISINPGSIQGGSSTWYLFGDFELNKEEGVNKDKYYFNLATKYPAPLDYGKDFYAMQLFYQIKSDTELESGSDYAYGIAWASNWQYTGSVPTDPWRSSMSLARKISIGHFQSSPETAILYIKSEPFFVKDSIKKLNFPEIGDVYPKNWTLNISNPSQSFKITNNESEIQGSIVFEIIITVLDTDKDFTNSNPGHLDFYFKGANDNSEYLRFGYEQKATAFYLDRSHSNVPWVFENPYFSDKISLNVMPNQEYEKNKEENDISIQYYVKGYIDRNIIELF